MFLRGIVDAENQQTATSTAVPAQIELTPDDSYDRCVRLSADRQQTLQSTNVLSFSLPLGCWTARRSCATFVAYTLAVPPLNDVASVIDESCSSRKHSGRRFVLHRLERHARKEHVSYVLNRHGGPIRIAEE